ncbi:MAG: patatin-like phospholipase family protein [Rhodospirillales bacterium]|nr:patatin-like phospholipase family protein [Rhodospirillales bacterium]
MADKKDVFEIGLAMAGAISAGAYSAGVVDFLFQALHEWQLAKDEAPDTVPDHAVCIRAAAGASAGSITAALAAAAVAGGVRPEKVAEPKKDKQPFRCVLPALYRAWVTMPDMASPGGGRPDLLSTNDLKAGTWPQSILNARILDDLTDEALELPEPEVGSRPGPAYGGDPLPYFAERFHLYLTLSNMRGVPYSVGFDGAGAVGGHYMMSHGDRAHYVIDGIGTHGGENSWLCGDTFDRLHVETVPQAGKKRDSDEQWQRYGRTALASAAFPLGLAARHIKSDVAQYRNRAWPGLGVNGKIFGPSFPAAVEEKGAFGFMSVDGGLIDNEPFEYVRRAIIPDGKDRNERNEALVTGAVVMIDPFPEPPIFPLKDPVEASIVDVALAMFPMLKNQVRFKPDELAAALDNTIYSRWMVAPSRQLTNDPDAKDEHYAIATGLLGGFGGFLDESFRAHDYQLGRRNCQKFLKNVFSVVEDHSFVKNWPLGVRERFRFPDRSGKYYCPIIPLVGTAALEVPIPVWPRIDEARLAEIERRIKQRTGYVLITPAKGEWWWWRLLPVAWWFCKERFMLAVHRPIEADLIRRDQFEPGMSYSAEARAVLAEMKASTFVYRTLDGLDQSIPLEKPQIGDALAELARTPKLLWSGRVDDRECWALTARRPSWMARHNPFKRKPRIG